MFTRLAHILVGELTTLLTEKHDNLPQLTFEMLMSHHCPTINWNEILFNAQIHNIRDLSLWACNFSIESLLPFLFTFSLTSLLTEVDTQWPNLIMVFT